MAGISVVSMVETRFAGTSNGVPARKQGRAVGLYPASLRYAELSRKRLSPSGNDPSRIILCAQTRAVSAFSEATAEKS
jgi:hypothetical protein